MYCSSLPMIMPCIPIYHSSYFPSPFHKRKNEKTSFFYYRYLRECDFGRINFWITSGMMHVLRKSNCGVTIAASTVRYRRSLELFQKVTLKTRVLAWDESAFYLEQRFTTEDGFVYAIVLTKNKVIQANKKERFVSPGELVQLLTGWNVQSPTLPHDLHLWIQYNSASSAMMKNAL